MSANTTDSRIVSLARQTACSCSRDAYPPSGALWPRYSPATTTASSPEVCASSATRYTANGTTSPSEDSMFGSSRWRRTRCTSQPIASPIAVPPTAAHTNNPAASTNVRPAPAAAATNTRNSVNAVASLMRLSPPRIVITRRGSPRRRPTDSADTASGGATTAPRTSAAAKDSPGTSHHVTTPTTSAVNATSPTARNPIGRMLARMPR